MRIREPSREVLVTFWSNSSDLPSGCKQKELPLGTRFPFLCEILCTIAVEY